MSESSPGSPSMEQPRWYLIRPPSSACTWWNLTSWSSVAEYSFTPMLTRPKDTAPRQIDRMLPLPQKPLRRGQDRQDRGDSASPAGRRQPRLPRTEDNPTGEETSAARRNHPSSTPAASSSAPPENAPFWMAS